MGDTCEIPTLTISEVYFVSSTGSPWEFSAITSVINGYARSVCMRCISNMDDVFDKTFEIVQEELNCSLQPKNQYSHILNVNYDPLLDRNYLLRDLFLGTPLNSECQLTC